MAENTFILTKDLSSLSEQERLAHMVNVCEAVGLDPKAGLLKYTMMDRGDGSGEKHLVLYATKGATDKLRDIHGISVDEMTNSVAGGAIVFTAKGRNKAGRTDIAVGSASIGDKKGRNLENAIMIAQTRANRRLTLQFSGSGLLDESEVVDDKSPSLSVDQTLQVPMVQQPVSASSEPGKDITAGLTIAFPTGQPVAVPAAVEIAPVVEAELIAAVEEKRIPNPAAGLKPVSSSVMASADGAPPVAVVTQVEVPSEEIKARRRRRTKAEMEAAKTIPGVQEAVVEVEPMPKVDKDAVEYVEAVVELVDAVTAGPVVKESAKTPVRAPLLGKGATAEQRTAYVAKLTEFRDTLVGTGKFLPSEGLGPSRKIREFVKIANNGADLNDLTVEQWDNTIRYFDEGIKSFGPEKLIETIEFNIKKITEPAEVSA